MHEDFLFFFCFDCCLISKIDKILLSHCHLKVDFEVTFRCNEEDHAVSLLEMRLYSSDHLISAITLLRNNSSLSHVQWRGFTEFN